MDEEYSVPPAVMKALGQIRERAPICDECGARMVKAMHCRDRNAYQCEYCSDVSEIDWGA